MDDFLAPIRRAALAMLDAGRGYDGGVFEVLSVNNMLSQAVLNKTLDRGILIGDMKSTFLSGGSLAALVFTVIFVVLLLALVVLAAIFRCRSVSQDYQFGQKLRERVQNVDRQLPVPLRGVFGLICVILLILVLVPLVLSFATNSRAHAVITETNENRKGSLVHQLSMTFSHVDDFLKNLVPQARVDVLPVINRTLERTMQMKTKSQKAYQDAFKTAIGATVLTDSSTDLLNRIELICNTSQELKFLVGILAEVENFEADKKLDPNMDECHASVCMNHSALFNETKAMMASIMTEWNKTQFVENLNKLESVFSKLPGALKATEKLPAEQKKMKEQKLAVSNEFNRNITRVFDRELNSTAFVIDSLNGKLNELEEKLAAGRSALANASARVLAGYSRAAPKYEKIRFIATLLLLLVLFFALVWVAVAVTVVLVLPATATRWQACVTFGVYFSYVVYALALCFVFCLFGATSMLQTEMCRYLAEGQPSDGLSTIDRLVVPEINTVIAEMKQRARNDPNKTDAIPLKGLGRLFGGIQSGCQQNRPILVALDSVGFIDTSVGDSSQASLEFKLKGRRILRREMNRANLTVLMDESMEKNMRDLLKVVTFYKTIEYAANASALEQNLRSIPAIIKVHEELQKISNRLSESGIGGYFANNVLPDNKFQISRRLDTLRKAERFALDLPAKIRAVEAVKDIASVIDSIIEANRHMTVYLKNQTLWTDTAAHYYTEYVIERSADESNAIASKTAVEFLSVIAKCRPVYDLYQASTGIPCRTVLYPLAILWFTLGWCVFAATAFSLLAHISIACFTVPAGSGGGAPKRQNSDGQTRMAERPQGDASETLLEKNQQTVI